jgi:plasmid stabilization system protein ParE
MSRLLVRLEAEADIAEAALWYEARAAGLGWEFVLELRAAIERAADRPRAFLLLRERPEVRRVLARRFPYRVFFIVRDDAVVVFAVIHAARDERHWRGRLRGSED